MPRTSSGGSSTCGAKWPEPNDEDQMETESLLPATNGTFRQKSKSASSASRSNRSPMPQRMSPLPRKNWFSKANSKTCSTNRSSSHNAPALVPPTLITSSVEGEDDDNEESMSDTNQASGPRKTVQLCPHGYANIEEDALSMRNTMKSPSASQRVVYSQETQQPRRRSLAREALHAIYFLNTDSPPRTMSTEFSSFHNQHHRHSTHGQAPHVLSSMGSSIGTYYDGNNTGCHHVHSSAKDANCNNCTEKDAFAMNALSSPNSDLRTKASSDSTHNSYIVEEIDGVDHVTLKIHSPLKNPNDQVGPSRVFRAIIIDKAIINSTA